MRYLKRLLGIKANQQSHNNEDARVEISDPSSREDDSKRFNWRTSVVQAISLFKKILFFIWILEKGLKLWNWICIRAVTVLEMIS